MDRCFDRLRARGRASGRRRRRRDPAFPTTVLRGVEDLAAPDRPGKPACPTGWAGSAEVALVFSRKVARKQEVDAVDASRRREDRTQKRPSEIVDDRLPHENPGMIVCRPIATHPGRRLIVSSARPIAGLALRPGPRLSPATRSSATRSRPGSPCRGGAWRDPSATSNRCSASTPVARREPARSPTLNPPAAALGGASSPNRVSMLIANSTAIGESSPISASGLVRLTSSRGNRRIRPISSTRTSATTRRA